MPVDQGIVHQIIVGLYIRPMLKACYVISSTSIVSKEVYILFMDCISYHNYSKFYKNVGM